MGDDYFNRKQHYSVNLQAIVDAKLTFILATVGYPGSIHNARVLRLSGLWPAVVPRFETCGKRVKKQGFIHR